MEEVIPNVCVRKSKNRKRSRDDLETLSKEELINRVVQLECHNTQLKNVITKLNGSNHSESILHRKQNRKFDFSKVAKRHVLLKLLYLGWDYQGFVVQEDTNNTIEYHLFTALTKCCLIENRETSNYHRCGRTDKGVSSFCQVISLDVRSKFSEDQLEANPNITEGEFDYAKMLNRLLPSNIRMIAWCPTNQDFSARFDCKLRTYKYFFPRGDLNVEAMNEAAQLLIGHHDFRNLCKMDVGNGVVNYERWIESACVNVVGSDPMNQSGKSESSYDMCELTIVGKAYLWHQIRCIMGILILVGRGQESISVVKELLDVKTHPQKPHYQMAHHLPLNLFSCDFDGPEWVVSPDSITDVIETLQKEWSFCNIKATMLRTMLHHSEELVPSDSVGVKKQSSCLLQGVTSRVYTPLLQRLTCSSLEDRISHYVKKQKLQEVPLTSSEEISIQDMSHEKATLELHTRN